jgi:uncharacterized protein
MKKLNQSTIEKLRYYVYILKDPSNGEIFYVGKGKGNRINSHSLEALVYGEDKSDKIRRIQEISSNGRELELVVLRHGLTEAEAFEIEAAAIDLLGGTLTNIMGGHHSDERGIMSIKDIELKYQAEPAAFEHNVLLIKINKYYTPNMTADELYLRTRSAWRISQENASKVEIACAVFRGIIREVYIPESWNKHPDRSGRWEFTGRVAEKAIRNQYIDKSVKHLMKKGEQTPFRYVWSGNNK